MVNAMLRTFVEKTHDYKKQNKREVVLVADHIKPRVAKIGYALRNKKYEVVLLLKKDSYSELDRLDFKCFDKVIPFSDKFSVYKKCLLRKPLVYHIFTEACVGDWAEYLIRNKSKLGSIVYDQYDVYRGMVTEKEDDISDREKFCLENADGLCCRMFETQYLKHKYGYKFKGKRILFLDYCWDLYHIKGKKQENYKHLRIVYGGRLLPISNQDRYRIELEGLRYITKVLQGNKDYFVIIPSESCRNKRFHTYRNITKSFSHLILKEPMSFQQLISFESHMDYGIDCIELKKDIEAYRRKKNAFGLSAKNQYYATNKYFDYLDAGIMPLYGRDKELFGRYLEHFGGALHCTLEELPDKLDELRQTRENNKKRACEARKIFAINNQIDRLIKFYKQL